MMKILFTPILAPLKVEYVELDIVIYYKSKELADWIVQRSKICFLNCIFFEGTLWLIWIFQWNIEISEKHDVKGTKNATKNDEKKTIFNLHSFDLNKSSFFFVVILTENGLKIAKRLILKSGKKKLNYWILRY